MMLHELLVDCYPLDMYVLQSQSYFQRELFFKYPRGNIMLRWKGCLHSDSYFITEASAESSWATLMKANKLETNSSVDWILLI